MPTTDDHGMPIYSGTEAMPGWAVAYNAQSTALGEALDDAAQANKDDDSCATVADLPVSGNWPGRVIMVEENDMLYVHDGTGWYIYGGKLPYFFGSRAASAVANLTDTFYITTTDYSRGVTCTSGELTFQTPGIYRLDQEVVWEPHWFGQRNLGVQGTGITFLGQDISIMEVPPTTTLPVSQAMSTYIAVLAPGSTAKPYVAHNAGVSLDVSGSASVMWVSA